MRRALFLLWLLARPALADGAFPNAMQVLTPADAPREIRLGTNFGLVTSEDAGKSWSYVCEPYITGGTNVILYAREADGTLLALADKLWRSSDSGCTWSNVAPAAGTSGWSDLFADPTSASRALGVSFVVDDGPRAVWDSSDGAQSFPKELVTGVDGVVSVESSASNPSVIYASNANYGATGNPLLARSGDDGATWTSFAIPAAPPTIVRILAVSPDDPDTLWLRATNVNQNLDEVWTTSDGGQTITRLYSVGGLLTGFARGDDGTIFLSDGNAGALVLAPGASAFVRVGTPHLLCLGRLGDRIFGCGDSLKDGFNLAYSDDRGATWTTLLSFPQISGPSACAASACASDWVYQQSQFAQLESKPGSGCATLPIDGVAMVALLSLWIRRRRERLVASDGRPTRARCAP